MSKNIAVTKSGPGRIAAQRYIKLTKGFAHPNPKSLTNFKPHAVTSPKGTFRKVRGRNAQGLEVWVKV